MRKTIILILLLLIPTLTQTYEIPSDDNYSPARDQRIIAILRNASNGISEPVRMTNLDFKKLRGYKVGGSIWDNEQWSSVIEIRNIAETKLSGSINLRVYDASGFLLDQFYLFFGELNPHEAKKESNQLFIKLLYIDQIASAELRSSFRPKT